MKCATVWVLLGMTLSAPAHAQLEQISNFRQYTPAFASAGQPSEKELDALQSAGFERIVYIAYSDHKNSLKNEDRIVKKLGMEYIHVPVEWSEPTASDFYLFAGAMQMAPEKKTLLHCQVNFRASAFSFLYRVVYLGADVYEAKKDMNSVWTPNQTWTDLILAILKENDVPECERCDWTPASH